MTDDADRNARHTAKMKTLQAAKAKILETKTVERGLVIVHTGPGKGKSTAAFGMALRMIGHGMPVSIVQFIKGAMETGEQAVFDAFPDLAEMRPMGEGFTWDTQDRSGDIAKVRTAWEAAKDPWFNFTSGNGFYSDDLYWIEHLDIPMGYIRDYAARIANGDEIDRPTAAISAERDRITSEYRELLDAEAQGAFDGKLGLARTVFPYVENHNFYIEHWAHSVIWRKMRQLGGVLVEAGFFSNADDIFLLQRTEVPNALFDAYHAWAVGCPPRGTAYWPQEIERRRGIMNALRQWSAPPALGVPPEVITEPFTVMLWGVTSDSVKQWLGGGEDGGDLKGFAASPGFAEGPARVILSADGISELQEGEILVAPLTAPSWAPVFGKIAATVTDVGGIMSHAAIVCREYGMPAVVGTGHATKIIKTGMMLRVDGSAGAVTIGR